MFYYLLYYEPEISIPSFSPLSFTLLVLFFSHLKHLSRRNVKRCFYRQQDETQLKAFQPMLNGKPLRPLWRKGKGAKEHIKVLHLSLVILSLEKRIDSNEGDFMNPQISKALVGVTHLPDSLQYMSSQCYKDERFLPTQCRVTFYFFHVYLDPH